MRKVNMTEKDILHIGNLKSGNSNASQGIFDLHTDGNPAENVVSMEQWVGLSTLTHIESRLSTSGVFGSSSEATYWLKEYISFCAKNGLSSRILSLFEVLFSSKESNRNSISESWLENISDKRKVIDVILIPTLGSLSSSCAEAQELLVHIYEVMKDSDMVQHMLSGKV